MIHTEIFGVHLLSALFLIGLAGSAIVVVVSFVEDFGELFSSDEDEPAPHRSPGH